MKCGLGIGVWSVLSVWNLVESRLKYVNVSDNVSGTVSGDGGVRNVAEVNPQEVSLPWLPQPNLVEIACSEIAVSDYTAVETAMEPWLVKCSTCANSGPQYVCWGMLTPFAYKARQIQASLWPRCRAAVGQKLLYKIPMADIVYVFESASIRESAYYMNIDIPTIYNARLPGMLYLYEFGEFPEKSYYAPKTPTDLGYLFAPVNEPPYHIPVAVDFDNGMSAPDAGSPPAKEVIETRFYRFADWGACSGYGPLTDTISIRGPDQSATNHSWGIYLGGLLALLPTLKAGVGSEELLSDVVWLELNFVDRASSVKQERFDLYSGDLVSGEGVNFFVQPPATADESPMDCAACVAQLSGPEACWCHVPSYGAALASMLFGASNTNAPIRFDTATNGTCQFSDWVCVANGGRAVRTSDGCQNKHKGLFSPFPLIPQ